MHVRLNLITSYIIIIIYVMWKQRKRVFKQKSSWSNTTLHWEKQKLHLQVSLGRWLSSEFIAFIARPFDSEAFKQHRACDERATNTLTAKINMFIYRSTFRHEPSNYQKNKQNEFKCHIRLVNRGFQAYIYFRSRIFYCSHTGQNWFC